MDTVLILDADRASRRRTISAVRYGGFKAETVRDPRTRPAGCCAAIDSRRSRRSRRRPGRAASLIEELRARTNIPIIVVSAFDEPPFRIGLLDAGADDYRDASIRSRGTACARRPRRDAADGLALEEARPIVTADFTMHLADRRLVRKTDVEVDVVANRVEVDRGAGRTRRSPRDARGAPDVGVGPQAADKTQYLRVHMASIRQKVEPEPSRPRYFVTVPGLGLRFDPEGEPSENADCDTHHDVP